ncbi:hypothetical protein [Phocaeicola plebeius]|jgi:hypothetical protein|uniref:hypothetical protein n=1 Tax=Phocaeicola plebeius TaxID=310297 RepID=UPI0026F0577E|nr:hypothetical protein [Phocaeicola plebeius]MCI6050054.1 hypothetical protein [Phocaeicola plebeius]MDD6914051.1 hypothetical protein [Phocaeicola plebeius]MDY5979473.1 hypothetical protein [Phocaeicola plebeius]
MELLLRDKVMELVSSELEALKQKVIENQKNSGLVASGRTIASMKVEVTEDGGVLWGRSPFGTLETGRKPGKVPAGFWKIIRQWMDDKGIQVQKPDSFAYLVARKIANEGTQLFRNGGRDDIYSPEVKDTVERVSQGIGILFGSEVEHINLNFNENGSI